MKDKKVSNIALDTIDKLNLIQVDINLLSNILSSWDTSQQTPNHNDMFGLSRLCDNISVQLNSCEKNISELLKKSI